MHLANEINMLWSELGCHDKTCSLIEFLVSVLIATT